MNKHKHKAVKVTGMLEDCFCLGCNDRYPMRATDSKQIAIGLLIAVALVAVAVVYL